MPKRISASVISTDVDDGLINKRKSEVNTVKIGECRSVGQDLSGPLVIEPNYDSPWEFMI